MHQFTKGNNNIQNITVINTQKSVTINGRTYKGPIRIEDNKIISNSATSTIDDKVINITVNGNVDFIETAAGAVAITGNATQVHYHKKKLTTPNLLLLATKMSKNGFI